MDAADLLADLDEQQRMAVATPSTLVAVIAAAGSGKTRVLTRRIAYRIADGSADARHTLALTFTREAAGELRRRLRRSGLREPVEAGTFHSVALSVLRQRWMDSNRPPPNIVNDPDRLLGEVAEGVPLETLRAEQAWSAALGVGAAGYTGAARATGRRTGTSHERVAAALERYELLKRRRGVIDLDDLLTMLTADIESDPELASVVRWRFRHLLVDEAQDLNPAQYRLLRAVLGDSRDLFLVGDPTQSIYGFNGSDSSLLADIDRHLPGVEIVRLPSNHRCTPEIVTAGMHALRVAGQPADAVSARDGGGSVEFVVAADELDEAARVADIANRCERGLVRNGQVAILARTHHQLAALRTALERLGVPMRRDALAAGTPLAAAVRTAAVLRSASQLRAWAHDIVDLPPATPGVPADAAAVAERTVAGAVLDFLHDQPLGDGAAFRSWVASTRPFARPGDADGVELLTFHAAKGREWHTVIVTGVETGLVPHRSATTVDAKGEEARLLHVAFTRASDRLVVTRALRRRGYARHDSPFVAGLEDLTRSAPAAEAPPEIVALGSGAAASPTARRIRRLEQWRDDMARGIAMLPTQICSDGDLAAIAAAAPSTIDELVAVTGFGPATASRHFDGIRAALDAADLVDC
ncbi:UvrD-helicase domain-containing protein [Desertimonas flava]|uniref:UvrD-helicase domain-containing protein n=1 Tax=Desertimonas flava TaxID=2064846 RepID=UPI0013C470E2|nr:UvrD-helicase domain-containing protein [Desertimonas flava]